MDLRRRTFLTSAVPACTMACLGRRTALAQSLASGGSSAEQAKHKFDEVYEKPLTNRRLSYAANRAIIEIGKGLKEELGDERAISLLKKISTEGWLEFARRQAKESPDDGFFTYTNMFRDPGRFKNTLTMEIVEDTEKAFELRVSECLSAATYLEAKAGDIGYAWVCFGDYAWAEGFNPKIKLVRDKTLMQGHDHCNHRYLWTG